MKELIPAETVVNPPSLTRRVSWGAIFAGFFVTMVIQLTLTLLGAAVGAASLDGFRSQPSGQRVAITSGIWLLVTGLISIWVGACVAGRLSGGPRRADGLIHGIVAWSFSTCVTLALLATTIGATLGGTGALLGGALSLGNLTKNDQTSPPLEEQVKNLFPQAGPLLPPTGRTEQNASQPPGKLTELAQKDPQLSAALADMEKKGGASQAAEDRDKIVNRLTSQHNMDQQEAGNLVQQWDQEIQKAKAQTEQKPDQSANVAHGVASGALWGFVALLLGLIFAAWGGWVGTATLPAYVEPIKAA